jgi:hypothetical protein
MNGAAVEELTISTSKKGKAGQVRSNFNSMLIFSFTVREFFTHSLFLKAKL